VAACISAAADAKRLAVYLETRRFDKQNGSAGGRTSGSTSIAPGVAVPSLLGFAMLYAGLTGTISGNTYRFRTAPTKLIAAMAKLYGRNVPPPDDRTLAVLERISFAVSFDTSRTTTAGSPAGSNLQANYQQLSQASSRILLVNDRDPLAPKNWRLIRE